MKEETQSVSIGRRINAEKKREMRQCMDRLKEK
jgi:hypothetical protein